MLFRLPLCIVTILIETELIGINIISALIRVNTITIRSKGRDIIFSYQLMRLSKRVAQSEWKAFMQLTKKNLFKYATRLFLGMNDEMQVFFQ